jgi:hypothetical protein
VIGVAKSAFRTATHAIAVLHGASARPLYVTAAGMPRADAAGLVRHMAAQHRLPDAQRRVDNWPPWPAAVAATLKEPTHSSAHRGMSRCRQCRENMRADGGDSGPEGPKWDAGRSLV